MSFTVTVNTPYTAWAALNGLVRLYLAAERIDTLVDGERAGRQRELAQVEQHFDPLRPLGMTEVPSGSGSRAAWVRIPRSSAASGRPGRPVGRGQVAMSTNRE